MATEKFLTLMIQKFPSFSVAQTDRERQEWFGHFAALVDRVNVAKENETPLPMTGLFSNLTKEQQRRVLEYDGPENMGPKEFRLKPSTDN